MGVGIHRSKIALYIYDKTFEDNDEDKIVDADFIERNMGFYEMLDEWKNLINHDVVSELVEPLYDELESFAVCTDTTIMIFYGLLVHKGFCSYRIRTGFFAVSKTLRATKVCPVTDCPYTGHTLIRVFMAWKASSAFTEPEEQELTAPERTGFTVVEWGGTEVE